MNNFLNKIKKNLYLPVFIIATIVVIGAFIMFKNSNTKNSHTSIKLFKPQIFSTTPIEKAIAKRRSIRDYLKEDLSLKEISQLLWAAQGITDSENNLRAAPSAGALYPIEIYLVASNVETLKPGVYKYEPKSQALIAISQIDKREELCNACFSQESVKNAPANIVICGIYERSTQKYGNRGKQYVHMEVGAIAENIYLHAVSLDIGTVYIGAFDDRKVQSAISAQNEEIPFCVMPVGKYNYNPRSKTMGTMGTQILEVDVKKVIEELRKAYADEWLAYYQYWLGARLAEGPMKTAVISELEQHALDELRHADMITERIIQLGGKPPLSPDEWPKIANCQYLSPTDPYVKTLLEQNIKGEQCAIKAYNNLIKLVKDKDPVTYNMVLEILEDEVEHEEDLENLFRDLTLGKH